MHNVKFQKLRRRRAPAAGGGRWSRPSCPCPLNQPPAGSDDSCCQRLGTVRTGTDPGTGSAGNSLLPTVIRCRFRSTIAFPIPFTCVRSSTR
ncbi:hypothetical protein G6F50_017779 [Rhizopus delemar]|uniref:Uncharacterized protein n=1 Tax=Rhizopus delemar TaxID=936053 RepID=A0A9P7BZU0_9FUNG|nr:hypothetical protein G6F50_017779 [Rhizopus delemar]